MPTDPLTPAAVRVGARLARQIFADRGNHSQVHLSEPQLAELAAVACQVGLSAGAEELRNMTEANAKNSAELHLMNQVNAALRAEIEEMKK